MKHIKRALSLLLTLALALGLIPAEALQAAAAAWTPEGKPAEITTSEGETVTVEDEWETTYPYGVFLFADGQADVTEGGEAATVKLYRLGGTQGQATAFVQYNPAAMQLDEDRVSYAGAAGYGDIVIEVEDPLPIAQYQSVGKAPNPERTDARLLDSPYSGEGAQDGDRVLTVDAAAESWQWYAFDGYAWQIVEDATEPEFIVGAEMLSAYDFRCVYTLGGVSYCTDSLRGEAYEPSPAYVPPEQPDGIDLTPEQSFTALEMDPNDLIPATSSLLPSPMASGPRRSASPRRRTGGRRRSSSAPSRWWTTWARTSTAARRR